MQKRLDKALELGADGVINSREKDAVQTILDLTDGLGCDLVIETAGTEITTRQAIEWREGRKHRSGWLLQIRRDDPAYEPCTGQGTDLQDRVPLSPHLPHAIDAVASAKSI